MRRVGRLELAAAAEVDRHVIGVVARAEEQQVARPQVCSVDRRAVVHLRIGVARDGQTVHAVEVPDQAGAVDYDAVAHHAGLLQPESLDALAGIDAVLAQIEAVAAVAPREYDIVVLSDHGQAQGETFEERYGEDLATLVSRLSDFGAVASVENAESSGAVNSMVAGGADRRTVVGRALDRTSARLSADNLETRAPEKEERFVVFGSGNLGLVYVEGETERIMLDELNARFPALVPGLASHPGVGFVVVDTVEHGPVALGRAGEHRLRTGVVLGADPLA